MKGITEGISLMTLNDNLHFRNIVDQDKTCCRIHDAIPSTSKGQNYISSEENQWLSSWEALHQFKQDHNASILNDMTATNDTQFENFKEPQFECNIMPESSKSFVKPRGRRPGKKKISTAEKKQKDAERKKISR